MQPMKNRPIEIVDVSARDGLQNEKRLFSTTEKLALIDHVLAAGAKRLEVASFVHPKYVPQMADAEAVVAGLPTRDDVTYIGLVLNMRGVDRALATNVDELGCVAVASDGFGLKNQSQTSAQSVIACQEMIARTLSESRNANVTVSTAFGCPFDGEVDPARVIEICRDLAAAGPREIAIADTIGVATPWHVEAMMDGIKTALPDMPIRVHFHDTRNTAIANMFAAVKGSAATVDASLGGLGGCPFAPNATGNVPLEDVIYALSRAGFETGMDLPRLIEGAQWLTDIMGRDLPGKITRAGGFP